MPQWLNLLLHRQPPIDVTDRSPLHPEALTSIDIQDGLRVRIHYDGVRSQVATIIGKPYIDENYGLYGLEMVRVSVEGRKGSWHVEERCLADMGIVPYQGETVGWNSTNYTLAEP